MSEIPSGSHMGVFQTGYCGGSLELISGQKNPPKRERSDLLNYSTSSGGQFSASDRGYPSDRDLT